MKQPSTKRLLTLLISILFILTLFLSITFIGTHTEHVCTGQDCGICVQLQSAKSLLKQLGNAIIGTAFVYTILFFAQTISNSFANNISFLTPILLKVRMNH